MGHKCTLVVHTLGHLQQVQATPVFYLVVYTVRRLESPLKVQIREPPQKVKMLESPQRVDAQMVRAHAVVEEVSSALVYLAVYIVYIQVAAQTVLVHVVVEEV